MASAPPPIPAGSPIPPPPPRPLSGAQSNQNDAVSYIVPYRNPKALIAYYLSIFALLPLIGLPLAIGAIILGAQGLAYRRAHPESHGTAHAWVAIGLAIVSMLYNVPMAAAVGLALSGVLESSAG